MSDAIGPPRRKRLSWECRCEIVAKVRAQGMSAELAAASSGVHGSTVYRLVARYDAEGWAGLTERRPVPRHQPRRTGPEIEERILGARAATRSRSPSRVAARDVLFFAAQGVNLARGEGSLYRSPRL